MTWSDWITFTGIVFILAGIVLVIWNLFQGGASVLGLALVIGGYLLQMLGVIMDLKRHGIRVLPGSN
jgi:hypothetical protein